MKKGLFRRILSSFLGGCMALACFPFSELPHVAAEINYGITIGSVDVTDRNAKDVLGDGVFSYNAPTNTLSVSGNSNVRIKNSSCQNLIINTKTDSTVSSLYINSDTTLTGQGRLTSSNRSDIAKATLTIKDTDFRSDGIMGADDGSEAKLIVNNSYVSVTNHIFDILGGITLEGCKITKPKGAVVKGGTIRYSNGNTATNIIIDPSDFYGFLYDDIEVTEKSFAELFGTAASYDPAAKKLTVQGKLEKKFKNYGCDGLTINMASMNDSYLDHTDLYKDTTVTGSGTISHIEVYDDAKLTLLDADIQDKNSLLGNSEGCALEINNSELHVRLYISGFNGGITLNGSELVAPENSEIRDGAVRDKDSSNWSSGATFERIGTLYGIYIGDKQITSRHADVVFGDGTVSYDEATNTLRLSGDIDLYTCKSPTIRNVNCNDLTIIMNATLKGSFYLLADTTITGNGSINPYGSSNAVKVSYGAALTLKNSSFEAEGAIAGSATGEALKISYCSVILRNRDYEKSAVNGFNGGIEIENCHIATPEGAAVKGAAILDAEENPILDELIIQQMRTYNIMIDYVSLTDENSDKIEDLFSKSSDAAAKIAAGEHFASFDPDTMTLTLKDVDIESVPIGFVADGLTLNLEGDVKFNSAITSGGEGNTMTITGPGSLTATGEKGELYSMLSGSFLIKETNVNAARMTSITDDGNPALTVFASNVTVSKGITGFGGGITLEESEVKEPAKCIISKSIFESDGSTVAENVVISGSHTHSEKLTKVEAVAAACETDGTIEYYQCSCGRKFADAEATKELTDEEIITPATGHKLKLVEEKPAACEEEGSDAYFICEYCGKMFTDETMATEITNLNDVLRPATSHSYGEPIYIWSADHSTVTAKCVCENDPDHVLSETVKTTYTDNADERTYVAEFTDAHFTRQTILSEITFTVTLNANGGTGTAVKSSVVSGAAFTFPSCAFTAPEGKKFAGWKLGEKTYQPGDSVKVTKNTTVKALWEDVSVTVLMGDVSGDGVVDQMDAILLARYAAAWESITLDLKAADLNDDGTVDNADAMILSRYVAGWADYDKYIVTKTV